MSGYSAYIEFSPVKASVDTIFSLARMLGLGSRGDGGVHIGGGGFEVSVSGRGYVAIVEVDHSDEDSFVYVEDSSLDKAYMLAKAVVEALEAKDVKYSTFRVSVGVLRGGVPFPAVYRLADRLASMLKTTRLYVRFDEDGFWVEARGYGMSLSAGTVEELGGGGAGDESVDIVRLVVSFRDSLPAFSEVEERLLEVARVVSGELGEWVRLEPDMVESAMPSRWREVVG